MWAPPLQQLPLQRRPKGPTRFSSCYVNSLKLTSASGSRATATKTRFRLSAYLNPLSTQTNFIMSSSPYLWLSLSENLALPSLKSRLKPTHGRAVYAGRGSMNEGLWMLTRRARIPDCTWYPSSEVYSTQTGLCPSQNGKEDHIK